MHSTYGIKEQIPSKNLYLAIFDYMVYVYQLSEAERGGNAGANLSLI
jgi:hypothetical protein